MGEAKRRGSFEKRKQEAIIRNEAAYLQRLKDRDEIDPKLSKIEENKTPERLQQDKEAKSLETQILAMSAYIYHVEKL